MFARNSGSQQSGLEFKNLMRPEQPPAFGGTPGMNPMANQGMGLMGRIANIGQQAPQNGNDADRKRKMLAMILGAGAVANGLR